MQLGDGSSLLNLFTWYIAFLISVTIHEFSHGFVAMKLGDLTAYRTGQVTLNPAPHIRREPIGMVVIPVVSFFFAGWMIGWGSSPYNVQWALLNPKKAGLMSLAGPASNFAILIITLLTIRIGIHVGLFAIPDSVNFTHIVSTTAGSGLDGLSLFISVLFSLNILLFIFNIFPFPPLDGSGIPLLFIGRENAQRFMMSLNRPGVSLVGLFIAWKLLGYIFHPLHLELVNFLYLGIAHYG